MTIAQLRAVLAILHVDPDRVGAHIPPDSDRGQATQQAVMVGLLHRLASAELRRVVTASASDRDTANAAVESEPVLGDNPAEQACFDASLLQLRIGALAANTKVDPAPVLLDAAARAADAAGVLVRLSREPHGADAESRWQRVLEDLSAAYHLSNDEHVSAANVMTQPIR
ncbi:hypothetical protein [Nocardia callitridis]|uniref:hypothetical protein n=1 Tax=Nocardia callitridis TaxID=648753 RepID=UPI0031E632DA